MIQSVHDPSADRGQLIALLQITRHPHASESNHYFDVKIRLLNSKWGAYITDWTGECFEKQVAGPCHSFSDVMKEFEEYMTVGNWYGGI